MGSVESPSGTWDLDVGVCEDWANFDPAVTGRASTIAVNQLWRLTGRRFGITELTFIPCVPGFFQTPTWQSNGAVSPSPYGYLSPYIGIDGNWHNAHWCSDCFTSDPSTIALPATPATEVTDVTIDGVSIPLANFQIVNHRHLHYIDNSFPTTQYLDDPWTVTYEFGIPVPVDGEIAAGILACELAKSMLNLPCRLPRKLQSISRQGVTMQLVDSDYLQNGLTGIQEVDEFIVSVNPHSLRERSRVYSPDIPRPNRITWSG